MAQALKLLGRWAYWPLLAGAFAPALWQAAREQPPASLQPPAPAPVNRPAAPAGGASGPAYRQQFIRPEQMPRSVHCPGLAELPDGGLLAVWYGGTAESAEDVALYGSALAGDGAWGPVRRITDPHQTSAELARYVRKIGNLTLFTDPAGTTRLFYVSVAVGGWSGSSVNVKTSADGGQTWTPARRLVLSPFLNLSTLVRCPPLAGADGTIALPAYHECLRKLPELVWLDARGAVAGKTRLAHDGRSFQPSIAPLGDKDALALLRSSARGGGGILLSRTADGGRTWTAPRQSGLPNPNSAIMAAGLRDGTLLLAFNNSPHGRESLCLARSWDQGRTWKAVHQLDPPPGEAVALSAEYSYPCILQARDGAIHVAYSWKRQRIKHVTFNEAWLEGRP